MHLQPLYNACWTQNNKIYNIKLNKPKPGGMVGKHIQTSRLWPSDWPGLRKKACNVHLYKKQSQNGSYIIGTIIRPIKISIGIAFDFLFLFVPYKLEKPCYLHLHKNQLRPLNYDSFPLLNMCYLWCWICRLKYNCVLVLICKLKWNQGYYNHLKCTLESFSICCCVTAS